MLITLFKHKKAIIYTTFYSVLTYTFFKRFGIIDYHTKRLSGTGFFVFISVGINNKC